VATASHWWTVAWGGVLTSLKLARPKQWVFTPFVDHEQHCIVPVVRRDGSTGRIVPVHGPGVCSY
jgi:hypothetical protein